MSKLQGRRPIEATFLILQKRYPDRSVLSIRKQFCMAYLEWKTRGHRKLKRPWVDLAVELRKGESKIGGRRTKLEKLARRHFQDRRRHVGCAPSRQAAKEHGLMQLENGIGIHDKEAAKRRSEIARENYWKMYEEGRHPMVKEWVITCRDGGQYRIRNLRAFCREYEINYRNLHFTAIEPQRWAKGFRARKYDPLTDENIPTREEYEKELGG